MYAEGDTKNILSRSVKMNEAPFVKIPLNETDGVARDSGTFIGDADGCKYQLIMTLPDSSRKTVTFSKNLEARVDNIETVECKDQETVVLPKSSDKTENNAEKPKAAHGIMEIDGCKHHSTSVLCLLLCAFVVFMGLWLWILTSI